MPVHDPPEDDPVGPYNRLSHTQADMYRRCPRMWFNAYQLRLKGGQPPIFAMGHAVEGSLNRVMRDSPVLVPSDAPSDTFNSPIEPILLPGQSEAKERPSRQPEAPWPALSLPTLPDSEWPKQRESLRAWALARLEVHFPREWAHYREEWENDPNRVGDWAAFEAAHMDEAKQWAANGIDFHLDEVEACLAAGGGPSLAAWRADGNRPEWPAPDGFPYDHCIPHPAAISEGDITLCEAWEIARPWFVDPDAGGFSLTSVHPDGWLGGEYDLVYRWTGEVRIFDIKASRGTSHFSEGNPDQMATYAYLWWATHNRQERVVEQEIWYLGVPVRKKIPVPNEEEMIEHEARLLEVFERISGIPHLDEGDFPTQPQPVPRFSLGGQPSDESPMPPEKRCESCEYSEICPGSPVRAELANGGEGFTPIADINPWKDIRGRVRNPRMEPQYPDYVVEKLEFFLDSADGNDWVAVVVKDEGYPQPDWLAEGEMIRLRDVIPALGYKPGLGGHIRIDVGGRGSIELAPDPINSDTRISNLRVQRWNVKGRIFNFSHTVDPSSQTPSIRYKKWGAKLVDSTGSIGFQIWNYKQAVSQILRLYGGNQERGHDICLHRATAKDQYGNLVLEGKLDNLRGQHTAVVLDE